MKKPPHFLALLIALVLAAAPPAHAQIGVDDVRAAQRTGSKLVDIDFDITGTDIPVRVSLEISADGGAPGRCPPPC